MENSEDFEDDYNYSVLEFIETIPPRYDWVRDFSEGMAIVGIGDGIMDNNLGFINALGEEIIPPEYFRAYNFSDGMAAVMREDGRWYFINTSGEEIISMRYDYVLSFNEGYAAVQTVGRWGLINKYGDEVVPLEFSAVELRWLGYGDVFAFRRDVLWGLARIERNSEH